MFYRAGCDVISKELALTQELNKVHRAKTGSSYWKQNKIRLELQSTSIKFRFGDGVFNSLGTMEISIPAPDGSFLKTLVDVVLADVPLLLVLDVLD